MDHVPGMTLANVIAHGLVSEIQALALMLQVCSAVRVLHARVEPIIHADLKPSNILVRPEGSIALLDFGLARPLWPRRSTSEPTGTLPYAPPEQCRGAPLDQRSDIYALGRILEEMVQGMPASQGTQAVIARACQNNPAQRYQQIDDLITDLRYALMELQPALFAHELLWWWLCGTISVVAVLGILTLPIPQSSPPARPGPIPTLPPIVRPSAHPPGPVVQRRPTQQRRQQRIARAAQTSRTRRYTVHLHPGITQPPTSCQPGSTSMRGGLAGCRIVAEGC